MKNVITAFDNDSCCTGCGLCAEICPKKAISMDISDEGFRYPKVSNNLCVGCELCTISCPALRKCEKNPFQQKSYAAYSMNEDVRYSSSSGGIFYPLAEKVILSGGVVYGVICNQDNVIKHTRAESCDELKPMMGSKYVQSDISDCFKSVGWDLRVGRKVLFSGTPCQVQALLNYIEAKKIPRKDLLTVDFVCHGVPSPFAWQKYLESRSSNGGTIKNVNFRDKISGWKTFSLSYQIGDKKYHGNTDEDIFLKLFLKNITLRKSCYNCPMKSLNNKQSDIMLADFWSVNEEMTNLEDYERGVSWVLCNTENGVKLFESLDSVWRTKVDPELPLRHNKGAITSASCSNLQKRQDFFANIKVGNSFNHCANVAIGENGIKGVVRKLYRKVKSRFMNQRR